MRDFNNNRSDRRSGGFGGRSQGRSGGRDFGGGRDREMHKAVCAECGRSCEVPFRPTGDKPVYCSNCFKREDSFDGGRSSGGRNDRDRSFGGRDSGRREDRQMHKAICAECGKSCEVPFRPSGDKPVYCSDCFGKESGRGEVSRAPAGKAASNKEDFEMLNQKLDKVLRVLELIHPTKKITINKPDTDKKAEKAKKTIETKVTDKKVVEKPSAKKVDKKAPVKKVVKKKAAKKSK